MKREDLVCPSCHGPLSWMGGEPSCLAEQVEFGNTNGVPDLVLPARRSDVDAFLEPYLAIRHDERWTDDDPELLASLPYPRNRGAHDWMWRVRARGFEALTRLLVRTFGDQRLAICERGAGVGWLANRLAMAGHEVLATDVNLDSRDGLGAMHHYERPDVDLLAAGAEMDLLPLADESIDVVVNAASFHYAVGSEAQRAVVREAARVLRPGGLAVILDSPVYRDASSGDRMVAEWRATHSVSAASGFVIRGEIVDMLEREGFDVRIASHWMGWRWTFNYARQRIAGNREPAAMPMISARRRPAS